VTTQLRLGDDFDATAPVPAVVDLRHGDARDLIRDVEGAHLVVSDPPWAGHGTGLNGSPSNHYATLSDAQIGEIHRLATDACAPGARLALWACWPLFVTQDLGQLVPPPWRSVTGGAWLKQSRRPGIGHHWLGTTEPVLIARLDNGTLYTDTSEKTSNGHGSAVGAHSLKPIDWQASWIRRWVPPGGLVLDLFAGLGSVAAATVLAGEGRRYVGAELNETRWRRARAFVRDQVWRRGAV